MVNVVNVSGEPCEVGGVAYFKVTLAVLLKISANRAVIAIILMLVNNGSVSIAIYYSGADVNRRFSVFFICLNYYIIRFYNAIFKVFL